MNFFRHGLNMCLHQMGWSLYTVFPLITPPPPPPPPPPPLSPKYIQRYLTLDGHSCQEGFYSLLVDLH